MSKAQNRYSITSSARASNVAKWSIRACVDERYCRSESRRPPIAAATPVSLKYAHTSDRPSCGRKCRIALPPFAFFRSFWARVVMGTRLQQLK
jgi:hypothetical protein